MRCERCNGIMEKDSSWIRPTYYKVNNIISFKCLNCSSDYLKTKYNIFTNSYLVEFLCSCKPIMLNKIGLILAHDLEDSIIVKSQKGYFESTI